MTTHIHIEQVDPTDDLVRPILHAHLDFAHAHTPGDHVHALNLHGLTDPAVTLFGAREHDRILGIGALKLLDPTHAELKSMHVLAEARNRGVGRALVHHLIDIAAARSVSRVSLETGTMDAFAPARKLYADLGFIPCEPFAHYHHTPYSTYLTLPITPTP